MLRDFYVPDIDWATGNTTLEYGIRIMNNPGALIFYSSDHAWGLIASKLIKHTPYTLVLKTT